MNTHATAVSIQTDGINPTSGTDTDAQAVPLFAVLRFVLALWSLAVWLLLVALPGVLQSRSVAGFALHFPHVLIGAVFLGGIWYACRALADGHLLWFSSVLFLLGGWM